MIDRWGILIIFFNKKFLKSDNTTLRQYDNTYSVARVDYRGAAAHRNIFFLQIVAIKDSYGTPEFTCEIRF